MSGNVKLIGLWYCVAATVQVYLAGLDCGDFVVASDGTVTVPYGSDPDGLLTPAYLKAISDLTPSKPQAGFEFLSPLDIIMDDGSTPTVTVPCVVGFTYTSQGQLVRPNTQSDAKTKTGPTLGSTRRIEQFAVLVTYVPFGVSFGIDFSHLNAALFRSSNDTTPLLQSQWFTGVYHETLEGDYNYDNMFCWQVTRPVMCNISAIEGFMETAER